MDPYINLPAMDRKKAGHYFSFTVFNNKGGRGGRGHFVYSTPDKFHKYSAEQPYFPVKSLDKLSVLNSLMEMVSSFDFPAISVLQNKFCKISLQVLHFHLTQVMGQHWCI
jgi:hypothetical protein